jgi:uncharacterized integral membrane protein
VINDLLDHLLPDSHPTVLAIAKRLRHTMKAAITVSNWIVHVVNKMLKKIWNIVQIFWLKGKKNH